VSFRALALLCVLAGPAQSGDLTILVGGDLLEHGGVVEVTAAPFPDATDAPATIKLTDRYAQVQLRHSAGAKYNYRFRPVPDAMARDGMSNFATEALSVGGRDVDGPDGPIDGDWRRIRVLPFAEYGAPSDATRTNAAWGQVEGFAALPPANHWGARALPWAFDTFGNRRTVRLVCADQNAVPVCTPNPDDALLLEALWWRSIAEGRLERLRHDALRACYDSGGLFGRPKSCDAVPGRGWPTYEPANR